MTPVPVKTSTADQRSNLYRLWLHVKPLRRKQFGWLLVLIFISSLAEVVSIGAVLPFLGILTDPERVFNHPMLQPLVLLLNLRTPESLLLPITAMFGFAVIMACIIRVLLLWVSTRLSFALGADLGLEIYRRTLYQPYSVHITRNSSVVIDAVSNKSQTIIGGVVYPLLVMISSGFMLVIVGGAMIAYQPVVALLCFTGFGCLYFIISSMTSARLQANSVAVANQATKRIKALQEGIGGIRDLLLDGTQPTYSEIFSQADKKMRRAQAQNSVISQSPRYLMEAVGMILISCIALWLALQQDGLSSALPIMGTLALAAQRLLPMLQQIYQGWSSFKGSQGTMVEVLDLLDQPLPANLLESQSPLPFKRVIHLEAVAYRYRTDCAWVLSGINIRVPRGSRIGIIGTTGSGKSTLVDIIMGLLQPTSGRLLIDGVIIDSTNARAWQSHIAHVPQAIYLADASIAQNIAFGTQEDKIDMSRVKLAATQAKLSDTISAMPNGYKTHVGERGVQLSGGQRQRIGIARALYKTADVIVLDEATSALDSTTEAEVMQAIDGLSNNITLFIIAHRLSTLQNCDLIFDLDKIKAT